MRDSLVAGLSRASGRRVITSAELLKELAADKSPFIGDLPIAAVRPSTTLQVSRVMKFCSSNGLHVTVRGGGSSLTGSSVPRGKTVLIDLSLMGRILEIDVEDRYAIVEPGVVVDQLNSTLAGYGYFYPPDPASSAFSTIGGNISTNAGGLRAVSYGTTKDWILGLEVVLPDGEVIRTGGRVLKRSMGYDLTALMVGSEGTLGVVTKATLKIWPKPEAVSMLLAHYSSIEAAAKAIGALKRRGMTPLVAEFIDRKALELMKRSKGAEFPARSQYALFVQMASTHESIARITKDALAVLSGFKPVSIETATTASKMERLYSARKLIFTVQKEMADKEGKEIMIEDTVVPASELPAALKEMRQVIRDNSLEVVLFGHIGDGNIHANIVYDPSKKAETAAVDRMQQRFGDIAIRHNGSVSGEHGIGLMKKELLKREFRYRKSSASMRLMRLIKGAFDPKRMLNRGKIFD